MAKVCVQCEKKIGMFKTPIDGAYCSYDCRDAARAELLSSERRSHERIVEAQRRELEHEAETRLHAQLDANEAERRSLCPKCGESWSFLRGGGSGEADAGKCAKCLYSAEFVDIEACPVCKGQSLVVGRDQEARCPRCKFRRHAERLAGSA